MNRLASLIDRSPLRSGPARFAAIDPQQAPSLEGLRLFTTAFLGGLVFFGTFLA